MLETETIVLECSLPLHILELISLYPFMVVFIILDINYQLPLLLWKNKSLHLLLVILRSLYTPTNLAKTFPILWFIYTDSKLILFIWQSCWGPNAPGGKSASSKIAKQAALAFVKRTLERCQQFELTGKSCFSEPLFREMFLSRLSQFSDAQQIDASTDGESGKLYINASGCSIEGRISGIVLLPKTH